MRRLRHFGVSAALLAAAALLKIAHHGEEARALLPAAGRDVVAAMKHDNEVPAGRAWDASQQVAYGEVQQNSAK